MDALGSVWIRSFNRTPTNGHVHLPWKRPLPVTARLRSQRRAEAYSVFSVVRRGRTILDSFSTLTTSVALPWTQSLNSNGTFRPHLQLPASGRTRSFQSTASRWISFPSFPPTSLPTRIVFAPVSCAVIGAAPSFNMVHYGPSCSLRMEKTT